MRTRCKKTLSFSSFTKRSDLHLSESQRVVVAGPPIPFNTISVRRVVASEVGAVQVGTVTLGVPPGTFVRHCTRAAVMYVVVLVSSAELLSNVARQRITCDSE